MLRLTPEVLDHLSPGAAPDAGWEELPGWDAAAIDSGVSASRGALSRRSPSSWSQPQDGQAGEEPAGEGRRTGAGDVPPGPWGLRRLPEAQAWASGVLIPDLRLVQGASGVRVCAVRSAGHGRRLAVIASRAPSGEPVLFFGHPQAVAPLLSAGLPAVSSPEADLRSLLPLLDVAVAPPSEPLPKPSRRQRSTPAAIPA